MHTDMSAFPDLNETTASDNLRDCPICGYQNPQAIDHCLNCASMLAASCPICHETTSSGGKFCNHCGAHLPENQVSADGTCRHEVVQQTLRAMIPTTLSQKMRVASHEILGEHREVTVLVVSLTHFTADFGEPDDEDIHLALEEGLRLLADIVYKYEGSVDKFTGQGLIALFGIPISHENDPERATRAALAMQATRQSLRTRLQQGHGLAFQMRIGLNTGQVIAGKVGSDLHMDFTAIGGTVDLALQVTEAAEPDTIVLSAETYQPIKDRFAFEARPALRVEQLPEPVQVFQPLGVRQAPKDAPNSRGAFRPMIGRTDDLARLRETWVQAQQQGTQRIALITGEAGLGKSRLVTEFRRSLTQHNVQAYQGSCQTYVRSAPLWLIADLLRDLMGLADADPSEVQLQALQGYLDQHNLASEALLPYLAHVLGLGHTDQQVASRLALLDDTMLQRQTHAALRQVFVAEARQRPTVLIFEDLHHLDPASRDFLTYLIHTTDAVPLFLVLVSRPAERQPALSPLFTAIEQESARAVNLQLQPLSEAEGTWLASQRLNQTTPETDWFVQQLVKRAAGNPLYIEEIVGMLIDQGGLVQGAGRWQVTQQANDMLQTIPRSVKGMLLARFDFLPEGLRRVLQLATVLGSSFPVSLLQSLNDTAPEALSVQLQELETRQFLCTSPFRSTPGYLFRQGLLQETIYHTLLKRDRRKIHTQVAQAVAASHLWLPEEQTERLAYHYTESTNPRNATPYLITAAENAARRCAYETAIDHYRRAMALLAEQPEAGDDAFFKVRIGLGCALKFAGELAAANQVLLDTLPHLWDWQAASDPAVFTPLLIDTLLQLADVQQREGAYDQALDYLNTGLESLNEAATPDFQRLSQSLLERTAWIHFRQGQLGLAFTIASQVIDDMRRTDLQDPIKLASLYNTLGGITWQQGQLDEAISYVELSLELYESVGYSWGGAVTQGNLGILHYAQGRWPDAERYYQQAYEVQQAIGNPEGQALSLENLGLLRLASGDHGAAQQDLAASLAIRQRMGDAWGIAQSHVNLAHLALIQTKYDEAHRYAASAQTMSDALGSVEIQVEARCIRALLQAEAPDLLTGLQLANQALTMARAAGLTEKEPDCLRVLGILHTYAGKYHDAEALLRDSLAYAQKQHDPYRQGLAWLELGRVYQHLASVDEAEGQMWHTEALICLDQAAQQFTAVGAVHDLQRAQTALRFWSYRES